MSEVNTGTVDLTKLFVKHQLTTRGKQVIGPYIERNLTELGNELADQYARRRKAQDAMRRDYYDVALSKEVDITEKAYQLT